jgi:hypothetical protein
MSKFLVITNLSDGHVYPLIPIVSELVKSEQLSNGLVPGFIKKKLKRPVLRIFKCIRSMIEGRLAFMIFFLS